MNNIGIILSVLLILILIIMICKKQYSLFIEAILQAEITLNSENGQKKIEYAVAYIKNKLPFFLKPIMTKKLIVIILEKLMNKGLKYMDSKETVDIKGNE